MARGIIPTRGGPWGTSRVTGLLAGFHAIAGPCGAAIPLHKPGSSLGPPSDLDLDTGELRVRKGKGGKFRTVVLDEGALAMMQRWLDKRAGLRLPRQTMCDWVLAAAEALAPIADCLMGRIRAGPITQFDDTPVKCQGGKGHGVFRAYLWTFVNPEVDGVVYRFTSGRASKLITRELDGLNGYLVGDGYPGNKKAADDADGEIVMTGCWAHTIRKFREAVKEAPGTAELFQEDIRRLYAIEAEADDEDLDAAERRVLRNQKARPILARLMWRGRRVRDDYSDAGKMAEALGYMRNQHKPLTRFLEDGRIPIDNNRCERSIRPVAVGRRNWLFAGSVRGGEAAATIYTLVESCRLAGVDMTAYLADVLVRVAGHPSDRIEELLPVNWAGGDGVGVKSIELVAETR